MSFASDLEKFARDVQSGINALTSRAVDLALESVRDGSALTGAPGQPVSGDTRGYDLKPSFFRNRIGQHEWLVGSKLHYAPWIEEGMLPKGKRLTLRSPVGGFGSMALTIAGWQNIVDEAARQSNTGDNAFEIADALGGQ